MQSVNNKVEFGQRGLWRWDWYVVPKRR